MNLDMIKSNQNFELRNASNKNIGNCKLEGVQSLRRHTFLDYVFGGCEISLVVAVDFTLSNGDPNDPKSLHFFDPAKNEYL
jgi:hypothetical protein